MFQVQKKNNELQDFDRMKIISGVVKAGGSEQDGEQVAMEVEKWLPTAVNGNVVMYDALKMKVTEVLKTVNPSAGESFENFKK